jgi:hypothetical protein
MGAQVEPLEELILSLQRTFGIIKPDAVANGNTGNIRFD